MGKMGVYNIRKYIYKKLEYAIKHYTAVQYIYKTTMSAVFRFMGLFVKTDPKLTLLVSYGGKQYSDSPKVLFEAMKQDDRFKDLEYVWAFETPDAYKIDGARKIKINSLEYFITALKAKIWITNVNIERGLNFKNKNTIYLNTWHGTGPKKSGNAIKSRKDYDFSRVDIFCCDGTYTRDVFIKWFGAKEESMLWCGRPREDELLAFTEFDKQRIREKLGIPEGKKIILYMPTWREYEIENISCDKWENKLGNQYFLLLRTHHFSDNKSSQRIENAFWKDVTNYSDVNELYCISDILISDYSSAFFDFGLLGKPMICYAYDYEKYEKSTGLFMDLKSEFPNGIVKTEDAAIEMILKMDYEVECQKTRKYCAKYVNHELNATRCCLDKLHELI